MPDHRNTTIKNFPNRRVPVPNSSSSKPNASQPPSQRNGSGTVKKTTNTTIPTTTTSSDLVPRAQQQRWTPPQPSASLPTHAVWGKQRPAPPEPTPLPIPSSQPSIHAAKPVTIVNQNNNNNNHQSQSTSRDRKESFQILQKKKPEAAAGGPRTSNLNSAAKEFHAKRQPGNDQTKPKGSMSTSNKPKAQPKAQPKAATKTTKNKPQLQSMSLGDMIMLNPTIPPMNKTKGKQEQQQQQQQHHHHQSRVQSNNHRKPPPTQTNMDLTQDFPSLSLSMGTTNPSNHSSWLLAKSTWGNAIKHQPPPPIPPTTTSTSLLASSSGPFETPDTGEDNSNKIKQESDRSTTKASASIFFQPKIELSREGEEHKLLRLLQERNVYQKKGRQRLHLRKKKFSALKKKVLQERLQKWRALHSSPQDTNDDAVPNDRHNPTTITTSSSSLCIHNYVHAEEVEDDDEYQEILENLQEFAGKVGAVKEIFIPRIDRAENYPVFVRFESTNDAAAALACWEGLVVGGERLHVKLIPDAPIGPDSDWKGTVLLSELTNTTGETPLDTVNDQVITIILSGILTDDDYDDEDCMTESLEDLRTVATKCGTLLNLQAGDERDGGVLITYQAKAEQAGSIVKRLQEWTIGGKHLSPSIVPPTRIVSDSDTCTLLLDNILTEDDLEDEDCLAETLSDIRELVRHHGTVQNVEVVDSTVTVTYQGNAWVAQAAATALNGMKLGGLSINARVMTLPTRGEEGQCIFLYNILTEEDLEDEDCLQESLNDIRTLASKHGRIKDLEVIEDDDGNRGVKVTYHVDDDDAKDTVEAALAELNGMVVGGLIVMATSSRATPSNQDIHKNIGNVESDTAKRKQDSEDESIAKRAKTDDIVAVKPLYSGDKLIPERFAEAKRVPKIPNAPGPREYAKIMNDESVKPLLTEMLGELMRLQKRAVEENNTKAKRRLVMGLREVARGIRSHKVKMVIMANNLDEYGAIDAKLQEIIDLAHNEEVPLFFEFTKRNLGKALGKTIKIAVVGVQNADGAHQPFKKLVALASKI